MGDVVIHADLEAYLVDAYRLLLAEHGEPDVEVDRIERDPPGELVVIRDDSGPTTSRVTAERMVGISVLAGTRESPKRAKDLGALAAALAWKLPTPDPANPVAAVYTVNGPYLVAEQQTRARAYFTVRMSVVGRAL